VLVLYKRIILLGLAGVMFLVMMAFFIRYDLREMDRKLGPVVTSQKGEKSA
jgi:predicted exporter